MLFGSCIFICASIFHFSNVNHDIFNSQEPMDENCYEQMKARPNRSVNEPQEAIPPAQVSYVFWIKGKVQPWYNPATCFKSIKVVNSDAHLKQPVRNFSVSISLKFWDLSSKWKLKGKSTVLRISLEASKLYTITEAIDLKGKVDCLPK